MKKFYIFLVLIFLFFSAFYSYKNYKFSDEIKEIQTRGVLLAGTTGDYCPMSCYNKLTDSYEGFDIALAEDMAKSLGVKIKYISTSWLTLISDINNKKFDVAISGITITDSRKKQALMTVGYLKNGKTVLCRKEDINKYTNLDNINLSTVRIIENPGGLNEKFVREHLPNANLIIHDVNTEIPKLISAGKADVMITEIIEANYYSNIYKNLAAPMSDKPFTKGQIGMLLPKKNRKLLEYANQFIKHEQNTGRINELTQKYIFLQNR